LALSELNIITVIAVILFARLAIRLYIKYRELQKENNRESDRNKADLP
jgi:preprotein translocase subunit SecG